jgi:hypothetical protein
MTGFYQNTSGFTQQQTNIPQQAVFQPGFAGTDAQVVRQQNAQSVQNQYGGREFQQGGQYGAQSFGGGFGPQAVFQQGFAGTNAQEVRQQNAQSIHNQYGSAGFQQGGQSGIPSSGYGFGQFSGPQAVFQQGFAGTNAQEVRQQNAQSSQNQFGGAGYQGSQVGIQQQSTGGNFGSQAIFQPGFAGTDAQVVRQQNAQPSQNQFGNSSYQPSGQSGGMQSFGIGQYSGPQAAFQPGFAGTDAQVVRQQNAQSSQGQINSTGFQQGGQYGLTSIGMTQFSGPQAVFQPGFAGTNAQEVRQQNSQSLQNRGNSLNQPLQ